jgi:hypothetical protein
LQYPPTHPKEQAVAPKNKVWFNAASSKESVMEEEGSTFETVYIKSERAQICDSLVLLAQNVDVCRDAEAKAFLLSAMSSLTYDLNPPKGELRDIKKLK